MRRWRLTSRDGAHGFGLGISAVLVAFKTEMSSTACPRLGNAASRPTCIRSTVLVAAETHVSLTVCPRRDVCTLSDFWRWLRSAIVDKLNCFHRSQGLNVLEEVPALYFTLSVLQR